MLHQVHEVLQSGHQNRPGAGTRGVSCGEVAIERMPEGVWHPWVVVMEQVEGA